MNRKRWWLSIAILIVLLIVWQSFFIVDEMEDAVVTFFGNPRRVYARQPGLKMKIPLLDKVYRFDNRLLVYEGLEAELLTFDKTNILITFYALWRVEDPLEYFKSVRDRANAEAKLNAVIHSALGSALGETDFLELINTDTQKMRLGAILAGVLQQCQAIARQEYGIELVDLRLKRLTFPDQVRQAVLLRIESERKAKSSAIRSEGQARATEIRSEADLQRNIILTEARKNARIRVGEGEATAARIWRETLEQNLDFYEFQKKLEVYEKAFDRNSVLFLPSDSPLMRLLLEGPETGESKE